MSTLGWRQNIHWSKYFIADFSMSYLFILYSLTKSFSTGWSSVIEFACVIESSIINWQIFENWVFSCLTYHDWIVLSISVGCGPSNAIWSYFIIICLNSSFSLESQHVGFNSSYFTIFKRTKLVNLKKCWSISTWSHSDLVFFPSSFPVVFSLRFSPSMFCMTTVLVKWLT